MSPLAWFFLCALAVVFVVGGTIVVVCSFAAGVIRDFFCDN